MRFVRRLKVLELMVESSNFDLMGAGTDIDGYCLRNDILPRTKNLINLTVEELVCNILSPVLDDVPMLITIEYSESDGHVDVVASYGGKRFDPAGDEDDFSYRVLCSTVKDLSYGYDPKAERANTIRVLI